MQMMQPTFFQFYQSLFLFVSYLLSSDFFTLALDCLQHFTGRLPIFRTMESVLQLRIKLDLQIIFKTHWALEVSTFKKCNFAFSTFVTLLIVINFYFRKHLLGENSFLLLPIREEIKWSILNIYHRMVSSRSSAISFRPWAQKTINFFHGYT